MRKEKRDYVSRNKRGKEGKKKYDMEGDRCWLKQECIIVFTLVENLSLLQQFECAIRIYTKHKVPC